MGGVGVIDFEPRLPRTTPTAPAPPANAKMAIHFLRLEESLSCTAILN
jgi:hypothetical protein